MLKTNAKKARENVRAYVLENARDYEDNRFATFREAAAFVLADFKRCAFRKDGRQFMTFDEYAGGLPLSLFDYLYDVEAVPACASILEETKEEAAKYDERKAERLLSFLIRREIEKEAGEFLG